jgi:hypothetical protein
MESKITSKWQNKYAQVFVVPPAWVQAYPMRRKSEAHILVTAQIWSAYQDDHG